MKNCKQQKITWLDKELKTVINFYMKAFLNCRKITW